MIKLNPFVTQILDTLLLLALGALKGGAAATAQALASGQSVTFFSVADHDGSEYIFSVQKKSSS